MKICLVSVESVDSPQKRWQGCRIILILIYQRWCQWHKGNIVNRGNINAGFSLQFPRHSPYVRYSYECIRLVLVTSLSLYCAGQWCKEQGPWSCTRWGRSLSICQACCYRREQYHDMCWHHFNDLPWHREMKLKQSHIGFLTTVDLRISCYDWHKDQRLCSMEGRVPL